MKSALPRTSLVRQFDTHRLIPSKYSTDGASVLTRIADDDEHLRVLFDLDHATNERLHAENGVLPGIGLPELLFGVPNYRIVNAAFTHPHPPGSRFNGPQRGAWYAALELETSLAEVIFHKTTEYAEINRFDDSITYDDYLADLSAPLHDLRSARSRTNEPEAAFASCLDPSSYVASQTLAERLLEADSLGVIYPSVRRPEGTCVACFRPAIVANVRKAKTYRLTWSGGKEPTVSEA